MSTTAFAAALSLVVMAAISLTASAESTASTAEEATDATTREDAFRYGGDPERGAEMAKLCTSCHGYQGRSVTSRYPSIAGMDETRFVEGMRELRAGDRGHRMASMTRGLTDQDIADLAAYYSRLEAPDGP
ncbi:c-type cytochrome [Halomonas campisalis]|uniref:C-type cytochrome n=1 Tax=Billgrantia campisalis TaxID=74661 RepID=A0ABS9P6G8_9GAMM|nr:c-type cytochrome [Halomonas campisalis]MCG6656842.1 c-type cytochrome [Halomonas campisalis]MDR5862031.1 c-type cytochrome [Halomonas campisalis]